MTAETNRLEVQQVEGCDPFTNITFILHGEDHTLGNSLRYIIMKNPEVEFCGYSNPHPAENKINFRIQTRGVSAKEVFRKGLEDLMEISQHVLHTFEESVKKFKENDKENAKNSGGNVPMET